MVDEDEGSDMEVDDDDDEDDVDMDLDDTSNLVFDTTRADNFNLDFLVCEQSTYSTTVGLLGMQPSETNRYRKFQIWDWIIWYYSFFMFSSYVGFEQLLSNVTAIFLKFFM